MLLIIFKFEIGEVVTLDFDHRKRKISFKCEVLDNCIFDTIPKRIDLIPKEMFSSSRSQVSPQSSNQSESSVINTRSKSKNKKLFLSDDSQDALNPISQNTTNLDESPSVEPKTSALRKSKKTRIKSIETQKSQITTNKVEQASNKSSFAILQDERVELKKKASMKFIIKHQKMNSRSNCSYSLI